MEAFESDDDFGDLYTDVEAQASSAIDGVPVSAPFRNDSVIVDVIGRNEKPSSDEENEFGDCCGSESEDDLNIVLNDEDCKSNSAPVIGDEDREDKNEDLDGFIVTNDDKVLWLRNFLNEYCEIYSWSYITTIVSTKVEMKSAKQH